MLTQPTIDKLNAMGLAAMAEAFRDQMNSPDMSALSFEERFGLIVDFQMTANDNRRMRNRLKGARLRLAASIEDIDFRAGRNLDRAVVRSLAQNRWVNNRHNILITGPTGAGKSYLACALAHKACRDGHTTLYQRLPTLMQGHRPRTARRTLSQAHGVRGEVRGSGAGRSAHLANDP